MYRPVLLLCVIAGAELVSAQSVDLRGGNVYFTDSQKHERKLTSSRADSDPTLSADGTQVIFVRRTAVLAGFDEPKAADPVLTQIWTASTISDAVPTLVFSGPLVSGKWKFATFFEPRFAADGRSAYFLIGSAAVENAIVRLDLTTHVATIISPALDYDLVPSGNYAGDLVAQKRRFEEGITSYYSYFFYLLSPDGKELGFVGKSQNEAQAFLRNPNRRIDTGSTPH